MVFLFQGGKAKTVFKLHYTGRIKKNRLQKNFTNVNKHFSLYERVFKVMVARIKVFWELKPIFLTIIKIIL